MNAKKTMNGRQDSSSGQEENSDSNQSGPSIPRPTTHTIETVFTSSYIERYDESGDVEIQTYSEETDVAASIEIRGEWGSAGFSLDPDEAWDLGEKLLEAADGQ